jgi:hypothetical protein
MAKMIIFINNIAIIRQNYWGIIPNNFHKEEENYLLDFVIFFFPITKLIIYT